MKKIYWRFDLWLESLYKQQRIELAHDLSPNKWSRRKVIMIFGVWQAIRWLAWKLKIN